MSASQESVNVAGGSAQTELEGAPNRAPLAPGGQAGNLPGMGGAGSRESSSRAVAFEGKGTVQDAVLSDLPSMPIPVEDLQVVPNEVDSEAATEMIRTKSPLQGDAWEEQTVQHRAFSRADIEQALSKRPKTFMSSAPRIEEARTPIQARPLFSIVALLGGIMFGLVLWLIVFS